MLGIVITGHENYASELLDALQDRFGKLSLCRAVNYYQHMSSNMLSRVLCDALHECDDGSGVILLTDVLGDVPFRTAAMLSHKPTYCEVLTGVTFSLLVRVFMQRDNCDTAEFRELVVGEGAGTVTSLWHQQQRQSVFRIIEKK